MSGKQSSSSSFSYSHNSTTNPNPSPLLKQPLMPVGVSGTFSSAYDNQYQQQQYQQQQQQQPQQYALQTGEISKHTKKDTLKSLDDMNVKFIFAFTILSIVVIVLFFGVGIAVFNNWWGFGRLNAAYFAVITFSTVGYGDFHPNTQHEQLFQVNE